MKGNKKILVIAILLLLIAVSYGTYAIYKSSISGTGTVKAAKWDVSFSASGEDLTDTFDLTFDASDCVNPHVATGTIAPGASCTKTVEINADGTEVDVEYELTVESNEIKVNGAAQPENSNLITASLGAGTASGEILMSDNPQSASVDVTITWGGEEGASYDSGDTLIGTNEYEITVPITIVAKQMVD